jgi:non-ribosomal peptide synthetase component E (peptide arylation enzyme)
VHTQRQVMTNAMRAVNMCAFTTQDVWLHAAPMFHAMVRFGCPGGEGLFSLFLVSFSDHHIHVFFYACKRNAMYIIHLASWLCMFCIASPL